MSYPHFYLADKQREMFDGLEPVVENHRTFLDVEPHTGMTLKIHTRIQVRNFGQKKIIMLYFQLNTPLLNSEKLLEIGFKNGVDLLDNLNYFPTFPFLWLDLTAAIDMVNDEDNFQTI